MYVTYFFSLEISKKIIKLLLTMKNRYAKIKKHCDKTQLNIHGQVAKRLNAADCKSAP